MRNQFTLKTDAELQIAKLQEEIDANTTKYGKKIAEADIKKVTEGTQTIFIEKSTQFKTGDVLQRKGYKIETYVKGNRITTILSDDKYTVKGVAKCHPDDRFDLLTGLRIAEANAYKNLLDLKIADYIKGSFSE